MKRFALALLALAVSGDVREARNRHAEPSPTGTSNALAVAALDRKIADLDAEEQASKKELEGISPQIQTVHARAMTRARSFYKLTRAGLLPVGGGFDALLRHAMDVEHARFALERDLGEEKRLRGHGADIARSLERVAKDREALASQRSAMDAARLAMEDEKRRQAAFEQAFEGSQGGSDFVIVGAGGPSSAAASGFAASRGRLLFPVVGKADVRPARREGADGPGLEILAAAGSVVRAIYTGHVAFADRYGAYGRIVILDHGEHFYSVSGNLGTLDVKVGDEVGAGERIGTVGDDGEGPMLYFEIRHGSQTIPPGPWLGL
ncbi:MAG TPA: peptidoglycan DD-metalloendopeptidase family protein [Polyangiaceae bacterium]|nr:peptidoglycan DD-metalloendopeptidase family protein [Polyangiaceae bacterium]